MRAVCLTFVLAIALACSGEPFTTANSDREQPATQAGSGGSQATPTTTENTAAGGSAGRGEPSLGGSAGELEPQAGGAAGAVGGEPAGGEGGAPDAPTCPSASEDDWELGYFPELRAATTHESHPFFQVTNRGRATTLDRIVIRYYFTKESDMAETAACYWITGDRCSLAKLEFRDMPTPTVNASRYLEVSFPGASNVMVAAGSLEVRVGFKTGSAMLMQTNDYSFDPNAASPSSAAPFPYKRWPQATLYVDGELVWGTEPCSSQGVVVAP